MFANLLKAMRTANPRITQRQIAKLLGLSDKSISERFCRKVEWERAEMYAIRDTFFPNETVDHLFSEI